MLTARPWRWFSHTTLPAARSLVLGAAVLAAQATTAGQKDVLGKQPDADHGGSQRPNILFIFSDDHAAHAISAYGSKINRTPNIDRLAHEGMLFRNNFVTNSICVPARATILTGKYSHLNGALNIGDRFEGSQMTFPKLLQQGGYETAMIGKWHLQSDPTGFDYWNVLIGQGPYYNPPTIDNGRRVQHTGYTTTVLTDLALDWLEKQRDQRKPFLLMYQHKSPHRNWEPGPNHLDTFDGQTIAEPSTLFDDWADNASPARTQEMTIADHMNPNDLMLRAPDNYTEEQLRAWHAAFDEENEAFLQANLQGTERTKWHYQRYIKDYLRCVQSMDDNIGRVLDYLDDNGLADNTIVIYSSDQGFFLGDHGWYDKRFMYEESLRAPFIVRWPGVTEPGSVDEHIVLNLDYAQTFLEMAGIDAPDATAKMQGRSLVPLLRGEDPGDWRQAMYYHYYDFPAVHQVQRHYGVRDARYKLISFYDVNEWELYDLQKDPDELQNVYGDPRYAEVAKRLKRSMKRLQEKYGDTDPDAPNAEVYRSAYKRLVGEVEPQLAVQVPQWPAPTDATGEVTDVDPAFKPLAVGAHATPTSGDGVIVSQGGERAGYSLYLENGLPHFAVRSGGEIRSVAGDQPIRMHEPTHLAGVLDADGELSLLVNGKAVATAPGQFITRRPFDPLLIGNDLRSAVSSYETPIPFRGQLQDVRVYVGIPSEDELKTWSAGQD